MKEEELILTERAERLPTGKGFGAPPLPLPGGRFLVAGGWPDSTDISLVVRGEEIYSRKVGDMPGKGRYCVSTALVSERFVVGFGGWAYDSLDCLWIFDLQTHRVSSVRREGEWHPETRWSVLVARNKVLYVIGGEDTTCAHALPFVAFSGLIRRSVIKQSFRRWGGLSFIPPGESKVRMVGEVALTWL